MIKLWKLTALMLVVASALAIFAVKIASAFSPDNWIAYLDEENSFTDIYLLDVDRGTTHNLSKTPFVSENQPYWSGAYEITHAYLIRGGEALRRCSISLFNLAQECPEIQLPQNISTQAHPALATFMSANAGTITNLVESPDQTRWAYVLSNSLYEPITIGVINRDGGGVSIPFIGSVYELSWSPDGNLLAVAARDRVEGDIEIIMINAVTGGFQQITRNAALDQAPTWSPDGNQIAFISDRDDTYSRTSLYVMNIDGSNVRRLTINDYRVTVPAWKP